MNPAELDCNLERESLPTLVYISYTWSDVNTHIREWKHLLSSYIQFLIWYQSTDLVLWQSLHFYPLNKKSCLAKKAPVTSPIKTSYKASPPSKFSNWQRLFTRSTITVKVTRLLALQVCLLKTRLLIIFYKTMDFG